MKTILPQDITSKEDVVAFFEALSMNQELFHPDDEANQIYDMTTDQRMFTDEEAEQIEGLLEQCRAHYEDICEPAYEAMTKYMQQDLSNQNS